MFCEAIEPALTVRALRCPPRHHVLQALQDCIPMHPYLSRRFALLAGFSAATLPAWRVQANGFALDLSRGIFSLAPILSAALGSVALVVVERRDARAASAPPMIDPRFGPLPGADPREGTPAPGTEHSSGSAVVIRRADGLLLTNHHVVREASRVLLRFSDGREAEATVVGSDEPTDIAVLKTAMKDLVELPVSASEARVGDLVMAVGYPFALEQTVTQGIISGLGRTLGREFTDFIQTDAAINSGNSGGALVDSTGRLIGINTAIYSRSGGNIGIGYAVPVSIAMAVMEQVLVYGQVRRGRLGVEAQNLDAQLADALGLQSRRGVVITRIEPGSPAEAAGIQLRDVVVEAGGRAVRSTVEFRNAVGLTRPDQRLQLVLVRGPERITVAAQLEAPTPPAAALAFWGARFVQLDRNLPIARHVAGAFVGAVEAGSAAAREGLRQGDIVTAIGQQAVTDLDTLTSAVRAAVGVAALTVVRGNSEFIVVLRDS